MEKNHGYDDSNNRPMKRRRQREQSQQQQVPDRQARHQNQQLLHSDSFTHHDPRRRQGDNEDPDSTASASGRPNQAAFTVGNLHQAATSGARTAAGVDSDADEPLPWGDEPLLQMISMPFHDIDGRPNQITSGLMTTMMTSTTTQQEQVQRRHATHGHAHQQRGSTDDEADKAEETNPPWPLPIHRLFVDAIMNEGLKRCSPAIIKREMVLAKGYLSLSGEKMKSHLQKYRTNFSSDLYKADKDGCPSPTTDYDELDRSEDVNYPGYGSSTSGGTDSHGHQPVRRESEFFWKDYDRFLQILHRIDSGLLPPNAVTTIESSTSSHLDRATKIQARKEHRYDQNNACVGHSASDLLADDDGNEVNSRSMQDPNFADYFRRVLAQARTFLDGKPLLGGKAAAWTSYMVWKQESFGTDTQPPYTVPDRTLSNTAPEVWIKNMLPRYETPRSIPRIELTAKEAETPLGRSLKMVQDVMQEMAQMFRTVRHCKEDDNWQSLVELKTTPSSQRDRISTNLSQRAAFEPPSPRHKSVHGICDDDDPVNIELTINESNVAFSNLRHGLCDSDEEVEGPGKVDDKMTTLAAPVAHNQHASHCLPVYQTDDQNQPSQEGLKKPPPPNPHQYSQQQPNDRDSYVNPQPGEKNDRRHTNDQLLKKTQTNADCEDAIDTLQNQYEGTLVESLGRSFQRGSSSQCHFDESSSSRPVVAMRSAGIKYPELSALLPPRDQGEEVDIIIINNNNNNNHNDNNQNDVDDVDSSDDSGNDASIVQESEEEEEDNDNVKNFYPEV